MLHSKPNTSQPPIHINVQAGIEVPRIGLSVVAFLTQADLALQSVQSQCATSAEDCMIMKDIPWGKLWAVAVVGVGYTTSDISYAVGQVAKFNPCPGPVHWNAVSRIFRYLNFTAPMGILYKYSISNLDSQLLCFDLRMNLGGLVILFCRAVHMWTLLVYKICTYVRGHGCVVLKSFFISKLIIYLSSPILWLPLDAITLLNKARTNSFMLASNIARFMRLWKMLCLSQIMLVDSFIIMISKFFDLSN